MNPTNAALEALYESVWSRLLAVREETDGAMSGPHLPLVPDGFDALPVRLAVVGQQTRGWDWGVHAADQAAKYPADGILQNGRSPFWRAALSVSEDLNGGASSPVLWTNLVAADVDMGKPDPDTRDKIRRAVPGPDGARGLLGDGLLGRVFDIVRPDAAVLFVGTTGYYGHELRQQFPGLEVERVEGFRAEDLEWVRHPRLPAVTLRTHHPRTMMGMWEIVEALPDLILDAFGRA